MAVERLSTAATIDEQKLQAFVGKVLTDWGSFLSATLVNVGDKVGLYRAMADGEAITPAQLAERTGASERYLREWLINQAASGYVEYDPATGRYRLPAEHAVCLTDESSPLYLGGGYQVLSAMAKATPSCCPRR